MLMFWCCFLLFFGQLFALFDVDEITNVNYGIDIVDTPVMMGQVEEAGTVFLSSKYGQQYQCNYLERSEQANIQEKHDEQVAMETGIIELLKPMEGGACLTLTKGWWTYEFCFGKQIRQYHVEDGAIQGNVLFLGHYESDKDWSNVTQPSKSKSWVPKYHTQEYTNGTQCDLTGGLRMTHVRFFCEQSQGDYISRVDETETCVYTLNIQTPRICHHPYLKPPPKTKSVPITCQPLLTPEQYEEHLLIVAEEAAEKLTLLKQQVLDIDSRKQTLGDVLDLGGDSEIIQLDTELDVSDTDINTLKDIITKSLIDSLKDVMETDEVKVANFKTKTLKATDLKGVLKKVFDEVEGQDQDESDKDEDDEDDVDDDYDEDEVDEPLMDEDKALMKEFDKGLDELAETNEQMAQLKEYKEELQGQMNLQFNEIIKEAQAELQEAGLGDGVGEIDEDVALRTMSDTLTKLLQRLEQKQATGHSKEISAMFKKAADETLTHTKDSKKMKSEKEEEEFGEDTAEDEEKYNLQIKPVPSGEDEDDEDEDDVFSMEYEASIGDKPVSASQDDTLLQDVKTHANQVTQGSRKAAKSYVKNYDYSGAVKADDDNEPVVTVNGEILSLEQSVSEDGKTKTKTFSNGKLRVKIRSKHNDDKRMQLKHDETEIETEKSGELIKSQPVEEKLTNPDDYVEYITRRESKLLTADTQQKVQDAVKSKLQKAGVNIPDHKIQVKIFTTEEFYNNEEKAQELFQPDGALNKMLIAVLGANSDEIKEAERQEKLESNYGYTWDKRKRKEDNKTPIQ